jgi:superfamily I DNA and/or RNA helicase
MLKHIDSKEEFNSLLDYYIACLEKEDMSSLQFNYRSEGKKFFSKFFKKERFFIERAEQVGIRKTPELEDFFKDRKMDSGNTPLFYGYPLIVDSDGVVKPLFFVEIFAEEREGAIVITKESIKPEFNHYVLNKERYCTEEIQKICSEINDEETFIVKVDKVAKLLGMSSDPIGANLSLNPIVIKQEAYLKNKSIIYSGVRGRYTHSLLIELDKLKNQNTGDLKSTSIGSLFNVSKQKVSKSNNGFLEVFHTNESQEKAIEDSFTKDINVITGPPGTGKSQVVLNIIANAVRNNKTVLFASRNNQAVDVVNEKLKSILPENLVVRMGNSFNRRNAVLQMKDLFERKNIIKANNNLESKNRKIDAFDEKITGLRNKIKEISEVNNNIEIINNKISEIRKDIPDEFYYLYDNKIFTNINKFELESDIKNNFGNLTLIRKLIRFIMSLLNKNIEHQIFQKHITKLNKKLQSYLASNMDLKTEKIEESLNWILNLKKIELLNEKLEELHKVLTRYPSVYSINSKIDKLREERIKISRQILENLWLSRLKNINPSDENHVARYIDISEKLEEEVGANNLLRWELHREREKELEHLFPFFPIWTVTNLSVRNSLPLKKNLFDLLVIDEASQCDIASALPLMFRAKQVVVIGDPKQLSHISTLSDAQDKEFASESKTQELYADYSFTKNSIYDIYERITNEKQILPTLLDEHYRCHPDIINFSNYRFYGGKLKIMTDEDKLSFNKKHPKGVGWVDVKGKTVRVKSSYNEDEANEIIRILESYSKRDLKEMSFGVVTIFKAQVEKIKYKIDQSKILKDVGITVGTCHKFQGDEKDIILFSPAVAEGIEPKTVSWINIHLNMTNVAITRARSNFIVVGDMDQCEKTEGILKFLAEYIKLNKKKKIIFDSAIEAKFYKRLVKEGVKVVPQFEVEVKGTKKYRLDFAYFVNGSKYDIEIDGDKAHSQKAESDSLRDIHLRSEGWKIRRYSAKEINNNIDKIINQIKRFC